MRVRDRYKSDYFSQLNMPKLKGHVKMTLHNCRTGKNEVYEGDNIITNAIRDIFARNYLGGIDYSKCLPLYQTWFGGILCYDTAHTIDADNYYPQSGYGLVAHAGDQAPGTAAIIAEDYTRGMPLNIATRDGEVAMTWEWGSEQGNGTIRSLSLTHKDTGNCGLGNSSSAFQSFVPFDAIQGSQVPNINSAIQGADDMVCQYDDDHGLMFYIGDDGDFVYEHTRFSTNKVTVYIRPMAYTKAGLYETLNATKTFQRKFTVTTTATFYNEPSFYFDYTNKKLWLFTNLTSVNTFSSTTIYYEVIDCVNETIDSHGTITSDTSNLAPLSMDKNPGSGWNYEASVPRFANIPFDGTYFYFPTTSGASWGDGNQASSRFNVTGLKRINFSNQADQSQISYNATQGQFRFSHTAGGLIVASGILVNGANGYECGTFVNDTEATPVLTMHEPSKVSSLCSYLGAKNNTSSTARSIMALKTVNTSLYNLDSAVTKNSSKSMQIEYTLTLT